MRRLRILLAEDDQDTRIGLARLLEFDGYDVSAVADGTELVTALASWILEERIDPPADLIITDIRMPGIDGLNILEGLRASGLRLPTIVMSAYAGEGVEQRVRKLEDTEFLAKPFNPVHLEAAVARMAAAANLA